MIAPHAYNPSIIRFQNRLLLSYRLHDRGDWRTNLAIAELDASLNAISVKPFQPPAELKDNSHEDARLFLHQNKLWLSWTVSQWPATEFRSLVGYGPLAETDAGWTVEKFYIPNYGKNDFTAIEKNFVFWPRNDRLYCLYLTHGNQQTILVLDGARVEEVITSKALACPWGNAIHGGAICEGQNGNLVHFYNTHSTHKDRNLDRYQIGVAELAPLPPFDMVRIGRKPVLRGEEGVNLDGNPRFKANVVFVCGAIREPDGYIIAFGNNDADCRIVKLQEKDLQL